MLISISFYHFDQKESKTNKDYEVVRKMIWFGSKNETLEVKRNLKTKQCGWYLNGYRQKDYDGTENVSIMEFSMLDVNANQNAIEHQSKQDEGSKIIRDSLKNAESYYKYLVQSGRQILFENFSSNYFEAYLLNGDKMERFIYISRGISLP